LTNLLLLLLLLHKPQGEAQDVGTGRQQQYIAVVVAPHLQAEGCRA
jgi:hypothetical protein